jgi:REP element-mobilizing transposase RayT
VTIGTKKDRCLSPKARTIVLNSARHFHNQRYELFAACVMPDHVHLLLQPWPKGNYNNGEVGFWPLNELMHSIKSFSAHRINELEKKTGSVWEKEQFDRYVRSDRDLQEKYHYILSNPWDSGVAQQNQNYPWVWTQDDEARKKRSFRRDAAATDARQRPGFPTRSPRRPLPKRALND